MPSTLVVDGYLVLKMGAMGAVFLRRVDINRLCTAGG